MTPQETHNNDRLLLVVALFALYLIFSTLVGCTTTRFVPVNQIRHDIEYRDRYHTDSIYTTDSVIIFIKGDTLYRDRTRYLYRDRIRTDTILVHTTDSIPHIVEVERIVSITPRWAWYSLAISIITLCAIILSLFRKFKFL